MHDVFISYKSEDEALAMRVRAVLEANGVPCWIAARDIQPGANYAVDIPAAIESASVFVLVLTEQAQESPWILKELDSAI
ncbi:MAG: toll/interleukin-1 receptor domain-containing protein, partial [Agathobacter sp.]|nr:toll/interleukin-1 receptor domain-containing protein [Agathobacter sp.]